MNSEPPGVSEAVCVLLLFALKQFELYFICYLKNHNQCNHTFVPRFCVLVYLWARWQLGWVWKIHLPVTSSLCGFSESWLKRNVHDIWGEKESQWPSLGRCCQFCWWTDIMCLMGSKLTLLYFMSISTLLLLMLKTTA